MIKIRLHGLSEDVETAKVKMKETFDVVACSGNYSDRGESKFVRAYIEAKIKDSQSTDQITEVMKVAYDKSKKENLI